MPAYNVSQTLTTRFLYTSRGEIEYLETTFTASDDQRLQTALFAREIVDRYMVLSLATPNDEDLPDALDIGSQRVACRQVYKGNNHTLYIQTRDIDLTVSLTQTPGTGDYHVQTASYEQGNLADLEKLAKTLEQVPPQNSPPQRRASPPLPVQL
ncbi:MAG: hypothetical protein KDJ15_02000 [Alphaproteobacteria bacterium]|nr:hypothetical protein [Alphaproteobacteria bacterium]